MRVTSQRLAGLRHEARQPRHATETDVETDTKTGKRKESAAAENDKDGDISSARVDDGMAAEPSARQLNLRLLKKASMTPWSTMVLERQSHIFHLRGSHAIICRKWLAARRHSLYVDEDHLSPTASSELLSDQRYKFSTTTSIQICATYSRF